MVCTEFGWWQDGDPGNYSSIVSSLVTQDYNLRQCNHMFPSSSGTPGNFSPAIDQNNAIYGGWRIKADRLFSVNGQFDPWRSAGLSSKWGPIFKGTALQQLEVVQNGHHCWDWDLNGAELEPDVQRVVDLGIAQMKAWVASWYAGHPGVTHRMPQKVDYWTPAFKEKVPPPAPTGTTNALAR